VHQVGNQWSYKYQLDAAFNALYLIVWCVWNVMAHAQKPDFVFRRNGRVRLNRRGRQFSRLPAADVCASAVVMLDTPCSEVVWRVLATHFIHQFPLHFPSRASPCAVTFQTHYTTLHVSSVTRSSSGVQELCVQPGVTFSYSWFCLLFVVCCICAGFCDFTIK